MQSWGVRDVGRDAVWGKSWDEGSVNEGMRGGMGMNACKRLGGSLQKERESAAGDLDEAKGQGARYNSK